jgi:hypothetical protein
MGQYRACVRPRILSHPEPRPQAKLPHLVLCTRVERSKTNLVSCSPEQLRKAAKSRAAGLIMGEPSRLLCIQSKHVVDLLFAACKGKPLDKLRPAGNRQESRGQSKVAYPTLRVRVRTPSPELPLSCDKASWTASSGRPNAARKGAQSAAT